jgi:hypothetical protein
MSEVSDDLGTICERCGREKADCIALACVHYKPSYNSSEVSDERLSHILAGSYLNNGEQFQMASELLRLRAKDEKAERMAEALRKVEWVGNNDKDYYCACCGNDKDYGHQSDCLVAISLAAYRLASQAQKEG